MIAELLVAANIAGGSATDAYLSIFEIKMLLLRGDTKCGHRVRVPEYFVVPCNLHDLHIGR